MSALEGRENLILQGLPASKPTNPAEWACNVCKESPGGRLQHSQPVLACIGNPTRSSALALFIEPHRWSHGRSAPRHGVVFWQIAQIDVGMHVRAAGALNTASSDRSISDFRQPRCMCRCVSVMRHPEQRNLPAYSPRRSPTTARRTKFSVEKLIEPSCSPSPVVPKRPPSAALACADLPSGTITSWVLAR